MATNVSTSDGLEPLGEYFSQVGYVVPDLDACLQGMESNLGCTFTQRAGSTLESEARLRGKPHALSIRVAFGEIAGTQVEIIQPTSGDNLYTEFLSAGGNGLHHTGFRLPTADLYHRYHAHLSSNGLSPVWEGRIEREVGVLFAYFDASYLGASYIEIMHYF